LIFALRHPAVLLGLAAGFAVGALLRVSAQRLLLRRRGAVRSLSAAGPLRGVTSPRAWLDPFGVVAVVLAGVGWAPRAEPTPRTAGRRWGLAVSAVLTHGLLAAAGLAVFVAVGGDRALLPFTSTASVLHGSPQAAVTTAQQVALGFALENLGCALLSIVPIPPLETGVAAWSQFPTSAGARRLAYRVLEEQWGVAVLLVLLLLPLAGQQPVLLSLVGTVGDQILHAL
jgi:hypothetical protein